MKKIAFLFLVLMVSACSFSRSGDVDLGKTQQVQKGVTTKADVLALFGKKYETEPTSSGEALIYNAGMNTTTNFLTPMQYTKRQLVFELQNNVVQEMYVITADGKMDCMPTSRTTSYCGQQENKSRVNLE